MQRDSIANAKRIAAERNAMLDAKGDRSKRWYVTVSGALQLHTPGRPNPGLDLGDR